MTDSPRGGSKPPPPKRAPAEAICRDARVIARLEHYVLWLDTRCHLVMAQRTAVGFAEARDVEACFIQIEQILADTTRSRYSLLVDTRGGPSRNDPAFESLLNAHRGKLLFGFAKNAALAATAAGRLQIQRYAKADGRVVLATDDVAAAFRYLGLAVHPI